MFVSVLGWMFLVACGGSGSAVQADAPAQLASAGAEEATQGWSATRWTQGRKYQVTLTMHPDPPPMGELFEVRARLLDRAGEPIEDAKVRLDARMPQHDHGMMTDPVDDPGQCDDAGKCIHPDGIYTTSGFKFHMGGEWTILLNVEGPLGPDNTSFVYDM